MNNTLKSNCTLCIAVLYTITASACIDGAYRVINNLLIKVPDTASSKKIYNVPNIKIAKEANFLKICVSYLCYLGYIILHNI